MEAVRIAKQETRSRGGPHGGGASSSRRVMVLATLALVVGALVAEAAHSKETAPPLERSVEAHVRATLQRELGLVLPPVHAECMPKLAAHAPAVPDGVLARVVELRTSDAAGAISALSSMGCTDAAMHVARVAVCAQQSDGLFAASVFLPVSPEAESAVLATARSLRGVRAALATSAAQPSDAAFDCSAAVAIPVPPTGPVSRAALDAAWPSLDEAWPTAGAWAAAGGAQPGQALQVRSRLVALPGIGQALSWLHFAACSTAGWGAVSASQGAPSAWAASGHARQWVQRQGVPAMVAWTAALVNGNRSVAVPGTSILAASLVASCHPWEAFMQFGPGAHNWTDIVARPPCGPVFDAGPEPVWRQSAAGPASVPPRVARASLCRLELLRSANWTCLPLASGAAAAAGGAGVAGGAAATMAWIDPALTSLAVLDALGAVASLRLVPSVVPSAERDPPATAVSLWRAGLRAAGQSGLLLSDPASGGTAFTPVAMRQAGPVSDGPWMTWGGFGEVSLSVAPHADAGAALPLVALPPLLRDECSLTDRFNASLVDERSSVSSEGASVEPFLLRITSAAAHVQSAGNSGSKGPGKLGGPGSSSGGGGGGNDDDGVNVFDWPVSAGVGLLTPSLAPSRRPVASLSAESVWYNASAGQLGPVWLRAQALAVAAARAAQLPVLAFEASRTASLALTVANKSGWAAAVTLGDGGTGHAKELPGSGLDVTAEGLWAAALVTIPRGEGGLPWEVHLIRGKRCPKSPRGDCGVSDA